MNRTHLAALGLALLLAAGCGSSTGNVAPGIDAGPGQDRGLPGVDVAPGPDVSGGRDAALDLVHFPSGFLWGTASAAFQAEGGNRNSDWATWVTLDGKVANGDNPDDGPDYFHKYDEDHQLAQEAGHNAIRISFEWSRFYPTEADFINNTPDPAAIAFYDALLASAKQRGLQVMVTLHHLTTPSWLLDVNDLVNKAGWVDPTIVPKFEEFARRIATQYGDRVDLWLTINEPQTIVIAGYIAGQFPPGKLVDFDSSIAVYVNMIDAHARAYDAIKQADTIDADGDGQAALVSFATHNRTFDPANPMSVDDNRAADRLRFFSNRLFIEALVNGNLDTDFDEKFDGPNDRANDPSLKGRLDYIGLNYYGNTIVTYLGESIPVLGLPAVMNLQTPYAKNDFGSDNYPQGFGVVIDELKQYNLPIYITENGVADDNDDQKARYVAEHLDEVLKAIGRGADVRGYFYWSLTDNFEWARGFCPRFGLWKVDLASSNKGRTPTGGVALMQQIIDANTIPPGLIDSLPPYGPAHPCP